MSTYQLLKPIAKNGVRRIPRVVAIEAMRQIKSWSDTIGNGWKSRAEIVRYTTRHGADDVRALRGEHPDMSMPGDTLEDWQHMRDYAIVIGTLAQELERYADRQIERLES